MGNRILTIYADGSCFNAAHEGGWAFLALLDDKVVHVGYSPKTISDVTSNKMEIAAATKALEWVAELEMEISSRRWSVQIVSDSQYTINGASKWLYGWLRGGWVNYERKPVANRLEWKRLNAAKEKVEARANLEWRWVRGHSNNFWNRAVDHMATYNMPEDKKREAMEGLMTGRIHAGSHPFRE